MTADPRLVPDAAVLEEVSYREAAELAWNGAKVLHPRTLAPLIEKRIPVWSKNSFAREKPGTKIVPEVRVPGGARAVTSMANVALVSVDIVGPGLNATQVMARSLDALARANTEVLALSSSSYRQNFCFLVRKEELRPALASLEANFALELAHGYLAPFEVNEDVGLLAVVGEGMQGTPGLAGRIFTAISRENINIIAIAQGSSELTIAIVVKRSGLEKAVQAVHSECRMAEQALGKSLVRKKKGMPMGSSPEIIIRSVSLLAKLTPQQVRQIRELSENHTQEQLAVRFGVSQSTISNLLTGKIYRKVV
jgi:aspartate kinase